MSDILKADKASIERDQNAFENPLDIKNTRSSTPKKKKDGDGRHSIINATLSKVKDNVIANQIIASQKHKKRSNPIIGENVNLANMQENVTRKITDKKDFQRKKMAQAKHSVLKEKRKSKPSSEWRTDGS